jgi:hypothetical protein
MSAPYLRFTGNVKNLKSIGFEFQKLFADNRINWSKEDLKHIHYTRIWKAGNRITLDALVNYEGRFFESFFHREKEGLPIDIKKLGANTYIHFAKNVETLEVNLCPDFIHNVKTAQMNFLLAFSAQPDNAKEVPERPLWHVDTIDIRALSTLGKLRKNGLVELAHP